MSRKVYTVTAQGIPKGQPRPRAFARKMGDKFVARVYDAGTAENWKQSVAMAWKDQAFPREMQGPLAVRLIFRMPRPKSHHNSKGYLKESAPYYFTGKPDCDNLAKAVLDCLTQIGAWKDDSQIVELIASKHYNNDGFESSGVTIQAQELEEQNS